MAANQIPEYEYTQRLKMVMERSIPIGRCENNDCKEMFRLYNDRFDPQESEGNIFCGGCVSRVFKRLKPEYEKLCLNK